MKKEWKYFHKNILIDAIIKTAITIVILVALVNLAMFLEG